MDYFESLPFSTTTIPSSSSSQDFYGSIWTMSYGRPEARARTLLSNTRSISRKIPFIISPPQRTSGRRTTTPIPRPNSNSLDTFNKRLDEWVSGSRLVLERDLEWPGPKPPPQKKTSSQPNKPPPKGRNNLPKKATTASTLAATSATVSILKRKLPHDE